MKTIVNSTFSKPPAIACYTSKDLYISPGNISKKRFQNFQDKVPRSNKRINDFINQAMAGTYQHTSIWYPNIVMSNGLLPAAENAKVVIKNDGNLLFTWSDNSGVKTAKANDKLFLITYFPAIKKLVYTLHAATRGSGQALLQFNKSSGCTMETWVGFVSHDERYSGDSVYAGKVML